MESWSTVNAFIPGGTYEVENSIRSQNSNPAKIQARFQNLHSKDVRIDFRKVNPIPDIFNRAKVYLSKLLPLTQYIVHVYIA